MQKRYQTIRALAGLPPLDVQVALRVPADTPDRAEALAETLTAVPGVLGSASGKVSRSAVMREAMLLGLAELERRHGGRGNRGRRA